MTDEEAAFFNTNGFPDAERNLTKILAAVSLLAPNTEESNVFAINDPQLFKYPVAYLAEAGYWTLTTREIVALRWMDEDGWPSASGHVDLNLVALQRHPNRAV